MPEGHTIHRFARLHREALGGRAVRATSPQGRFADGAAVLDGRVLVDVEAHGKHLFYRWADAPTLHVHLGLIGGFRQHVDPAPAPTSGTRLRLAAGGTTIDLAGAIAVELVDADEESRLRAPLGPDPLRRAGARDAAEFAARLTARRIPVGAALLDQRVVAGIGNVYRAEVLFLCGIDPGRPASGLFPEDVACLWRTIREQLRAGERAGRIVTVSPRDVGVRARADIPDSERVYVYKRAGLPCRRCGAALVERELGGRRIASCPVCQPAV